MASGAPGVFYAKQNNAFYFVVSGVKFHRKCTNLIKKYELLFSIKRHLLQKPRSFHSCFPRQKVGQRRNACEKGPCSFSDRGGSLRGNGERGKGSLRPALPSLSFFLGVAFLKLPDFFPDETSALRPREKGENRDRDREIACREFNVSRACL
jgi:hypothetical protein